MMLSELGGCQVPSRDGCGRLWSLWDVMNQFDVAGLLYVLHEMHTIEGWAVMAKIAGQGASKPTDDVVRRIRLHFAMADGFFRNHPELNGTR